MSIKTLGLILRPAVGVGRIDDPIWKLSDHIAF